jgi:hypothetical protein
MMCKFLIAVALLVPISAHAASITTTAPVLGGMPRINIDGDIAPGDAQAFAAIAKDMPKAAVFLRSGGGDLDTGIATSRRHRRTARPTSARTAPLPALKR